MAAGELVEDELVESIVRNRLQDHDWNFGFVIDGFPRNVRQAEFFLESYDIDGVVLLEMPDEMVAERVLSRRICAACGLDYNVVGRHPDEAERCDRVAIMHTGKLAALGPIRELKATFAERPIVELRGPEPVAMMAWLDESPLVEKTSLFGTAVHAVLRSAKTPIEAIVSGLKSTGLDVVSASSVVPSLEDVFLDVVDRLERGGA